MGTATTTLDRPIVAATSRIAPYAASVFSSALLLFLIQPMVAKQLLPRFGGAAAVWTACLMFFQFLLLLGYLYADWSARRLSFLAQGWTHAALVAAAGLAMWIPVRAPSPATALDHPVWGVVGLLAGGIGLPYFVLSSTSPLLQSWYAGVEQRPVPYRLYALSNLGSLLALLAYPFLVEPALELPSQMTAWRLTYLLFAVFAVAVALRAAGCRAHGRPAPVAHSRVGLRQKAFWVALAACPSILLLAVTNELCQDIAPIPLLWIAPLAVYLVTFIICFDHGPLFSRTALQILVPVAMVTLVWVQANPGKGLLTAGATCLGGLFVIAMFCHGRLAASKPEGSGVTSFYLCISVGGAMGGLFVGLAAPFLFADFRELQVGVAICLALSLRILFGYRSPWFPVACAGVAMVALHVFADMPNPDGVLLFKGRNFYGTVVLRQTSSVRTLLHGMTVHGSQFLTAHEDIARDEPTTYYGRRSGAGIALQRASAPQRVGVVGLGAGTLAAYGRPGDTYRFYEINPLVDELARSRFSFLKDSGASVETILGDARLSLQSEPPQDFDTLVLDAFSGDSIPMHLLTREAFQCYFGHLKHDGILAVHISNRYLDLAPVVANLAGAFGRRALRVASSGDARRGLTPASWMLVGPESAFLVETQKRTAGQFVTAEANRLWTDRYSNILGVLRRLGGAS